MLENMSTVRAFAAEPWEQARYDGGELEATRLSLTVAQYKALLEGANRAASTLSICIVIALGGWMALHGTSTVRGLTHPPPYVYRRTTASLTGAHTPPILQEVSSGWRFSAKDPLKIRHFLTGACCTTPHAGCCPATHPNREKRVANDCSMGISRRGQ
jgi:ABC-type multidrug transport system fused ATPase/permease subunit